MIKLLLALTIANSAIAAPVKVVPNVPKLYIQGDVTADIVVQADQVRMLASKGHKTINLIINSPGGSVYAGLQFINAMIAAQSKDVKFKCYVGGMAASMAFQFLAHCDERYATPYALLLWHPARTSAFAVTENMAAYLADRLAAIEELMLPVLLRAVGMDEDLFMYHYHKETLWTALELDSHVPDFITIVPDIEGVTRIWTTAQGKKIFQKFLKKYGRGK
jgi:ATP-dependent protease ClpP protease subunit